MWFNASDNTGTKDGAAANLAVCEIHKVFLNICQLNAVLRDQKKGKGIWFCFVLQAALE